MRTWAGAVLAVALGATNAFASEAGHGDDDVAGYIFHHVSDSPEYEFELPGPLYTGHNPKIDLFETFAFLRIPLTAGACPTDVHAESSLTAGCLDLRPTKHAVMMWLAAALLLVSVFLGSHRNPAKLVPKGTAANIFEALLLFIRDEVAVKNIGKEEATRYTPFLASIFFFILFMNFLGLIPWMATATANLAVTCGLALCTFVLTQTASVRSAGVGGYLKHLTGGVHWALWPIMIPVEILGLFTKPFALTVRLFANMLAGHIVIFFLLGLIFLMHPAMALVSVPMALGIFLLEIFVALVQAYVFTMLSALFIGMGVAMGHHHHEPAEAHAAHADVAHASHHQEGARPAAV